MTKNTYNKGYNVGYENKPNHNPYHQGSNDYLEWEAGYEAGKLAREGL